MGRHEDLGKTSGTISRSVFIALLSLLGWLALPGVGFASYHGQHPLGARAYGGGGVRPYNWGGPYRGAPYTGAGPYYAGPFYGRFQPNAGRLAYIRAGAPEQPHRGRQGRTPYRGGGFRQARPPYQGGRFQQARPPYSGGGFEQTRPSYRPPYQGAPGNGVGGAPYRGNQGGYQGGNRAGELHLPGWIQQHGNMPLADQERLLQNEPGYKQLPPESQQRLLRSLRHIESLPPEQRERTLGYIEAMERLSPERRQQVTASVYAIRTLPLDRQRMVTTALRDLIQYPPQERQAIMAQRQFQSRFSPEERNILSSILAVEPYEPHAGPPLEPGFQPGR